MDICYAFVSWWNGEYEGNCELSPNHDGDHWDGVSWFREDEDGSMICTDDEHEKEE